MGRDVTKKKSRVIPKSTALSTYTLLSFLFLGTVAPVVALPSPRHAMHDGISRMMPPALPPSTRTIS
ncbi:hypothetical protein E2562_012603 [Oryza meyeriana var. granulata]|uniref:Uncharacterized protein n=1 Tax=Oryza meyeriana var. granulata TaxID=110450 RepID=A0A6G1CH14_9ORYZ|nr:hypothetical protein E2562_012603 [Oryza meyeriana var. granulata]